MKLKKGQYHYEAWLLLPEKCTGDDKCLVCGSNSELRGDKNVRYRNTNNG